MHFNDTFEGKVTQVRQEVPPPATWLHTKWLFLPQSWFEAENRDWLPTSPFIRSKRIMCWVFWQGFALYAWKRELSVRRTKWLMLRWHKLRTRQRQYVQGTRGYSGHQQWCDDWNYRRISEGDVIITGATSGKMPGDGASASQRQWAEGIVSFHASRP